MKKYLSVSIVLIFFLLSLVEFYLPAQAQAATVKVNSTPVPLFAAIATSPTPPTTDNSVWVTDSETTFAGKNANRSKDMVNWVLTNYRWSYDDHTLVDFWTRIRNVVFVFLILLILITAFTMIITGGQSITAIQFFRKFLIVIFLITFSYAFIRILYQIVDIIISFFIKNPQGQIISTKDLLNISFDYVGFQGWRRFGYEFDESAFISLLLTKVTAITYFVMAGILIVRKVILWFFITVSPVYPVLMFYYPIRNTAKIWIGEFFRWLLYAPLFTIFLSGLVVLWQQNIGLLPFHYVTGQVVYPTAVNILLGGPGQTLQFDNSINYTDTFVLYIVALIMLWIVIFLPFVLLRIFLDYLSTLSLNKDQALSYVNNAISYFTNKENQAPVNTQIGPPPKTPPAAPAGIARPIPVPTTTTGATLAMPRPAAIGAGATVNQYSQPIYQTAKLKVENANMEALRMTNLSIPTLRDVARYETTRISSSNRELISKTHDVLEKIANPASIQSSKERLQFNEVRQKLLQEKLKGNPIASTILNAADNMTRIKTLTSQTNLQNQQQTINQMTQTFQKLGNPATVTTNTERQQLSQLREVLSHEQDRGNNAATSILNIANSISSTSKITQQNSVSQLNNTLEKLANPASITSETERQQYTQIRERLTQQSQQGNQIATSILNAASNISSLSQQANQTTNIHNMQQTLERLSNPSVVTTSSEKQQYSSLRETLLQEKLSGNNVATSILSLAENYTKSSQQNKQQVVNQFSQTLEKLANPAAITDQTERQQFTRIKEKLTEQQTKGNQVATTILNIANNISTITHQNKEQILNQFQETLEHIANPTTIINEVQKQQFNQLRQQLTQESQQGNQFATTILNAGTLSQTNKQQFGSQTNDILQKLGNPSGIPSQVEKAQVQKVTDILTQEQEKKNTVAATMLASARGIKQTLTEAETNAPSISLPAVNQVQTVSLDDYEAVKKMWQDNYHKLDVPKTIDKPNRTREEWIKEDMSQIDQAISLLVSNDQQKVKQGMGIVSNILPFLLIGGFSQTEVIAYLKAKSEAAKAVLTTIKEESEKVEEEETTFVTRKQTETQKVQRMHAENEESFDEEDQSDLTTINQGKNIVQNITHAIEYKTAPVNTEILKVTNLSVPTMEDVVSYETKQATSGKPTYGEVTKIHTMLANIANPQNITDIGQKQLFTQIREQLLQEQKKGNPIAISILTAAQTSAAIPTMTKEQVTIEAQRLFEKISNATILTNEKERKETTTLKEQLFRQSQQSNNVATTILAMSSMASHVTMENREEFSRTIEKLLLSLDNPEVAPSVKEKEEYTQVKNLFTKESANGNTTAVQMLELVKQGAKVQEKLKPLNVQLPQVNEIQKVNLDDYENIKRMWEDNYLSIEIPRTLDKPNRTREEWLADEIKNIEEALTLLMSEDAEKKKRGMNLVSNILPFLLIGGFSHSEVIAYLKAKLEAAKTILAQLRTKKNKEDDEEVFEPVKNVHETNNDQQMAADIDNDGDKKR